MKRHSYKMKTDISAMPLLKAVDACTGDVTLKNGKGDVLDLKSQLCRYLLLAAASDPEYLNTCRILCGQKDAELLKEYIF